MKLLGEKGTSTADRQTITIRQENKTITSRVIITNKSSKLLNSAMLITIKLNEKITNKIID